MSNVSKKSRNVALLFALTYMVSYITRTNYGAIISEMTDATGFSKSALSVALTCSFVTYGIGQIISGIAGDKISPKKLVMYGLSLSVAMNLLIPLCKSPLPMAVIWGVNGFAQSFMWPPIVKIMSGVMTDDEYKKSVATVSYGSSAGTVFVYLVSPIVIATMGWKSVFFLSASVGVVMIFVWKKFACDVAIEPRRRESSAADKNVFLTPVMLGILVSIVLQGMLRDGVTTWMPSYIADTYNIGNEISILTGVILPIFGVISFTVAGKIYREKLKNPILCAALFFGVGMFAAVGLAVFTGHNAAVSVLMSALLTGCMHSVNLMLICIVPNFFKSTGRVSTISGVLNSCTYVGSAISTYGVALLSESAGWGVTVIVWAAVAACGTLICTFAGMFWNKTEE